MRQVGKFLLFDITEFKEWLNYFEQKREVKHIQQHHTWVPAYRHFDGNNHFKLCESMERSHRQRGFDEIGQNITTFPDGTIMMCRNLNTQPAGIKYHNKGGICIEHVGDFDKEKDILSAPHRTTIIEVTQALLNKFKIKPDKDTLVYHHWFDLNTGARIEIEGNGNKKSCPGTAFFGGNTVESYTQNFLKLFK